MSGSNFRNGTFKRRHFCPSCHQKRLVEFGEWLCMDVLKKIPHRHFVFSIPKILRRYFLYDRKLLADLSRCAWESLKVFIQDAVPEDNPIPGAVIAIQTFLSPSMSKTFWTYPMGSGRGKAGTMLLRRLS